MHKWQQFGAAALATVLLALTGCGETVNTAETTRTTKGDVMMELWENTYSAALYDEQYRNQFHFSPAEGWMNDINGLWYADGLYHMCYQWCPDLNWKFEAGVSWGHATSPDLIHWTQQPPAIRSQTDCAGEAFSGSAVIDVNNTSGLGAGTVVAAYTDTIRGQCLAYSTDGGMTFKDYEHNPVVTVADSLVGTPPGTVPAHQRDPKLFWYEPDKQWIMVTFREHLSETGEEYIMEFFASPDMKSWTHLSDFSSAQFSEGDFRECPDMYQLTLEGTDESFWILQSASTKYYVGRFDGQRFTVVEAPGEVLCGGPDVYAGQTFFNTGSDRTISIYWLDNWKGSTVPTTPWRNAASFPSQLVLRQYDDGMRIARTPITEITSLYECSYIREDRAAKSGENPLEGLYAQCFDMTIELSVADTDAKRINIDLMDKSLFYATATQTLYSLSNGTVVGELKIPPADGKLKLRFLVDADSIEIFCNDGRYTYAEELGFPYNTKEISLTADAEVAVPYVEFHQLSSIW